MLADYGMPSFLRDFSDRTSVASTHRHGSRGVTLIGMATPYCRVLSPCRPSLDQRCVLTSFICHPHLHRSLVLKTCVESIALRCSQRPAHALAGAAAEAATAGLCVLNTHLFYHPQAPHIRTMHTAALMAAAHTFLRQLSQPGGSSTPRPSVVFCGDLNSDLNEGIPGWPWLL